MGTVTPVNVASFLRKNGIVLDAIMVGEGTDNSIVKPCFPLFLNILQLRSMAKSSGGYAFGPQTLTEGLRLNELETLLSMSERAKITFDTEKFTLEE